MNELLLQGLSELGLDVSRAETLERFSSLLLEKNEVMKNRLVPNHSLPSSHEAIVSSSGTSR